MQFPWISRSSHEAVTSVLTLQLAELKEERKLLLDRLATLGLGAPLYSVAVESGDGAEPDLLADPDQDLVEELMRLRRRPAKLADALSRRAHRQRHPPHMGPKVAWIPQMNKIQTALDEAEAQGKQRAEEEI